MSLSYFPQERGIKQVEISLPMDLVMGEILTRLPPKSLMRFKCVSKLWSSLIRSRYFGTRFLTVTSQPRPRLYLYLSTFNESVSVILSSAPDTTSTTSSSFVVDHDLTFPDMGGYMLQNFRGFMCYSKLRKLKIYNPATRQLITLPSINNIPPPREVGRTITYFFGHDPVNDQYKVVCSISVDLTLSKEIRTEHWVFVLKPGEGSWRKLPDFCYYVPVGKSQCTNGVIYYMAYNGSKKISFVIRSFHIRSEEFKTIEVPTNVQHNVPHNMPHIRYCLTEYVGKLTLLDHTDLRDNGPLDLWVLEDAVNMEWSRKSLVLQPCQLHLVNNTTFYVNGTTQNGKVLFTPLCFTSPFYFLCYDLQNNDMRKIEIKGIPDHLFSKYKGYIRSDIMFMDYSESVVVHLE